MKIIQLPAGHSSGLSRAHFGRLKPPPSTRRRLKLGDYVQAALPTPPASTNWAPKGQPALGNVMCNDRFGCCTCSGTGHVVATCTGNAGKLFTYSDAQVLAMYAAVCPGFDPNNPATDNGANEDVVLDYLTTIGFADGTKLAGRLALNQADQNELRLGIFLFLNHYYGIDLPDAWVNPFPSGDGFIWDVAGDPDPANGHCVVGVDYNDRGIIIDSWGLLGTITWAAIAKYCSPAAGGSVQALLLPDMLPGGANPVAPNGFDWPTLQADLVAL